MDLTGQGLADFAKSKLGTPYVYGAKLSYGVFTQGQLNSLARSYPSTFTCTYIAKAKKYVGRVCTDCSGLISGYTGRLMGSAQMYSTASKRIPIAQIESMPVGAVMWKSGHVGVYQGDGKVVEAKGINYGTIESNVKDTAWKYGLLYDYINYDSAPSEKPSSGGNGVKNEHTSTGKNPYPQPVNKIIKKGNTGTDVKWVQWELEEAGYDLSASGGIDGKFGATTDKYVKAFQKSCKLTQDGQVGPKTQKAFINNKTKAGNPYPQPVNKIIKKGNTGTDVKWVQWELEEAGYDLSASGGIDGKFGATTDKYVKAFQKSCKLTQDGQVGPKTQKAFINN